MHATHLTERTDEYTTEEDPFASSTSSTSSLSNALLSANGTEALTYTEWDEDA